ncbi:MAG TPA: TetR/AcrR family transcriptional regulator [Micromonosporaceae bacterium]|nr:TetR/AcrR family transcriptional regulator [Micromonosporaceae bacterium]
MTATPTRRERLRAATVHEIKAAARGMLVAGGSQAISLRAIAREMGMTAPAIYRYFPSLEALISDLVEDLFDELRGEVVAARDAEPNGELERMVAMARAFRRWSVGHPAEFALLFGNPVPGVAALEDNCFMPEHGGARFGAVFLDTFAALWHKAPFRTPPPGMISEELAGSLLPYGQHHEDHTELPVEVIYLYLSGWTRLYGLVALEVFGHNRWALSDPEPLFETELAVFADQLGRPA